MTKILSKTLIFLILILAVLISGCSNNLKKNEISEINSTNKKNETVDESKIIIVAYGDSLTEGLYVNRTDAYPAVLERELIEKGYNVKVYNSGLSGETSSGALNRVGWVLRLNPDIVILGIGANDAMRGISINVTKENIEEIILKLHENNVTVILSGQEIFENLGKEYSGDFKEIYPQIAKEQNVLLIPFFLEGVAANSSLNNIDEIHPNKEGYEIIVKNNVLPKVIEAIEQK